MDGLALWLANRLLASEARRRWKSRSPGRL
jgi:hypothetical protein